MIKKMMALSLAGLVAFAACKKSDSPTPKPPATDSIPDSVSIIGKWSLLRSVSYYYDPTSGAFIDSDYTIVGSKDYYDFEKGGVFYHHEDDGSTFIPYTDTLSYKFYGTKNILWASSDGAVDTVSYRLTKD